MALDEGLISGLLALADSERSKVLTTQLVLCESLRDWLENSKEGKTLNQYLMTEYSAALDAFEACDLSDTDAMIEAKMQLTACTKVYNIFNQVFHDAQAAENELTQINEPE